MSLLEAGDFAQATVPLAKAARWRPRRARSARRSAAPTSAAGSYAEAATEFEAVVERYPVNDYAHFCLGRALTLTGQRDGRAATWRSPPNLRPERARLPRSTASGWPRSSREPPREGAGPARQPASSTSTGEQVGGDRAGTAGPARASRADDTEAEADRLADKVRALRIFDDADGRMNEPLGDREVLCVSQFTLYGDTRKGNRPSFADAAPPELAEPLYERFCERLGAKRGVFGARMAVELVNDGPVTLMLEA